MDFILSLLDVANRIMDFLANALGVLMIVSVVAIIVGLALWWGISRIFRQE